MSAAGSPMLTKKLFQMSICDFGRSLGDGAEGNVYRLCAYNEQNRELILRIASSVVLYAVHFEINA